MPAERGTGCRTVLRSGFVAFKSACFFSASHQGFSLAQSGQTKFYYKNFIIALKTTTPPTIMLPNFKVRSLFKSSKSFLASYIRIPTTAIAFFKPDKFFLGVPLTDNQFLYQKNFFEFPLLTYRGGFLLVLRTVCKFVFQVFSIRILKTIFSSSKVAVSKSPTSTGSF